MSIINMIEKRVEKEVRNLDASFNDKPLPTKQGMAFMKYTLKNLFNYLDENDIEEGIVDSSYRNELHDYGIDAIYLTANNEVITSPDEVDSYNQDTKFVFHIFQFKKGGGIDQETLMKLEKGIEVVFVKNETSEVKNSYLYERMQNLIEIRDKLYEIYSSKQILINVYVCFSGVKENVLTNDLLMTQIDDIKKLLRDNAYSNEFTIVGAQELIDYEREKQDVIDVLTYRKTFKYITEADENSKLNGYICVVNASEVGNLVKKWQSLLFEANIRDYYKKNDNNSKILETCSSEEEGKFFWSFNNGLTITCERVEELPNDKYRLHGLQIVNGCQTSNAIYQALANSTRYEELKNKGVLSKREQSEMESIEAYRLNDKATILVKIIETGNPELIYKITETTNSQTAIKVFSLKANDDIHKNIEGFFKDYDIFYERRVNFYKNAGVASSKIVDIKKVAQLFYSMIKFKPSQARSQPKSIFTNNYDEIFPNTNVLIMNYRLYLVPVLVHQKVEKAIKSIQRTKTESDDYKLKLLANGKFHIDCLVLSSILKKEYNEKGIVSKFEEIRSILNDEVEFLKHFHQAVEDLKKIVQSSYGAKKELVSSALRKSELDAKIVRFVKQRK